MSLDVHVIVPLTGILRPSGIRINLAPAQGTPKVHKLKKHETHKWTLRRISSRMIRPSAQMEQALLLLGIYVEYDFGKPWFT
jgi:hypothetical protein